MLDLGYKQQENYFGANQGKFTYFKTYFLPSITGQI